MLTAITLAVVSALACPATSGGGIVTSGQALVASGQETRPSNRRAPKISMPHELPAEPLVYRRTWTRHRVDLGEVMADAHHESTLTVAVTEVDDKGNRTVRWEVAPAEWTRNLNEGELVDRAADTGVAELRTGVAYELLLSPKYRTLLLEDPDAARVEADRAVARAEAEIEAGQYFYAIKERAKSIVQSAFATPELVEYTFLEEPTILFQPLGRSYRMNEDRRWQDYFVNPIGIAPLPALSVLAPVRHDEAAGTLEVHWSRELAPEEADPILKSDLTAWRRRLKQGDELPSVRELFALREEVRYVLDLATGLPLYAERRAFVRIASDVRVETVSFVRAGYEPPAELTGEWGAPEDESRGEAETDG